MDYGKFRSGLKAHLFAKAYPELQHLLEKATNDNIYFRLFGAIQICKLYCIVILGTFTTEVH